MVYKEIVKKGKGNTVLTRRPNVDLPKPKSIPEMINDHI